MSTSRWMSLAALSLSWLIPTIGHAQPIRQMPGTRPFLVGMLPQQGPPLNTRVRPAASQVGVESTDFYGKRGYPKQLGDAVEALTTGTGASGMAAGGVTGNTGVQSSGSAGFQGNTGNQIGQNGGGTILGGLFGGGGGVGGSVGAGFGNSGNVTGGGFSGLSPKGFGFGGTPH